MLLIAYDMIMHLVVILLLPYYMFNRFVSGRGKQRQGLCERLGIGFAKHLRQAGGRPIVWIHAVSVGETNAALPLIKKLRQVYPDLYLLLSNVTETGHAIAVGIHELDAVCFLPFDLSWSMRRVFKFLRPELLILIETELWPNLIRQAERTGVKTLMINGRISDRSFPRYLRVKAMLAPLLRRISLFSMQSQVDMDRIIAMGAEPSRVQVNGNTKFDFPEISAEVWERSSLWRDCRLPAGAEVLVAGSTHVGEETQLLEVFSRIRRKRKNLRLVLVPRHPQRRGELVALVRAAGFRAVLRSSLVASGSFPLEPDQVLIGDSLGEMQAYYALADVVFVGGSLVPVGGHNLLEAGMVRKPVIFGPHMHNFRKIRDLVKNAGAGRQVEDCRQLALALEELFADPVQSRTMGAAGYQLIAEHRGAVMQTVTAITPWL
ncbi:MAG: 3-deoxy-D-manno-octulosonic acid transferase, partial [Deltaproteobacteria bacterium]|nr:3-deoxy-D-manno-octulosonic acid transferase [Deltaproteobacteria bacterium]